MEPRLSRQDIEPALGLLTDPDATVARAALRALVRLPLEPDAWIALAEFVREALAGRIEGLALSRDELILAATRIPVRSVRVLLDEMNVPAEAEEESGPYPTDPGAAGRRSTEPAPDGEDVSRRFEALLREVESGAPASGAGDEVVIDIAEAGDRFRPDVSKLVEQYRAAWGGKSRELRWQIAWSITRAAVPQILPYLVPELLSAEPERRMPAVHLLEDVARTHGRDTPPVFRTARSAFPGTGSRGVGGPPPAATPRGQKSSPPPPPAVEMIEDMLGAEPPESESAPGEPAIDEVHLAVSAPDTAQPGDVFIAQFAAYVKELEAEVQRQLEEASPDWKPRMDAKTCRWARDTQVVVRLSGKHLTVDPAVQDFVWSGTSKLLDFTVEIAADAPDSRTVLKFEVFVADVRVAMIPMNLRIAAGQPASAATRTTASAPPARTAFASYSSADAHEVLGRISSIRTAAGLDVFTDCLSLHPGDKWKTRLEEEIKSRDVFLLFWSDHAQASSWVEWEWRCALAGEPPEKLQLHPLEQADTRKLPVELKDRHFRDVYLLVRDGIAYNRERREKLGD